RKYGPTLADVLAKRDALSREAADLEGGDERLASLERERSTARTNYLAAAGRLSRERKRVGVGFGRALEALLGDLAMERTRFEVRFGEASGDEVWTTAGVDIVEFYVSPNPGEDLRPLTRVVSGGELSRVMLALKTLTATSRNGFNDADDRPPSPEAPGLIF